MRKPTLRFQIERETLGGILLTDSSKMPILRLNFEPLSGLSFSEQKARQFFDHLFSLYPNQFNGILSVVFLPEDQHCEIHGKFLQDYRPTDVITFPADEQEGHAGEILVSVDQAVIEASQKFGFTGRNLALSDSWLASLGWI